MGAGNWFPPLAGAGAIRTTLAQIDLYFLTLQLAPPSGGTGARAAVLCLPIPAAVNYMQLTLSLLACGGAFMDLHL